LKEIEEDEVRSEQQQEADAARALEDRQARIAVESQKCLLGFLIPIPGGRQ
jgi:hypothetical protein